MDPMDPFKGLDPYLYRHDALFGIVQFVSCVCSHGARSGYPAASDSDEIMRLRALVVWHLLMLN